MQGKKQSNTYFGEIHFPSHMCGNVRKEYDICYTDMYACTMRVKVGDGPPKGPTVSE